MQPVAWFDRGVIRLTTLPNPLVEVVPGVAWGCPGEILSPAFWALQAEDSASPTHGYIVDQGTLIEEVAFCLLGGFGVKVELAEAYHQAFKAAGAYTAPFLSEAEMYAVLAGPVEVGTRRVRYRFPKQKAARLAAALPQLLEPRFDTRDALRLRHELLGLKGIGPKTASWIVRNWLGSDEVAILDIHVVRACQTIGVFPAQIELTTDYDHLEAAFLQFSKSLGVRASVLDAVIWNRMREFSPTLIHKLTSRGARESIA